MKPASTSSRPKYITKQGKQGNSRLKALVVILSIALGISLAIPIVVTYIEIGSIDLNQTVNAIKSGGNSANQGIGQRSDGGNSANQGIGQ